MFKLKQKMINDPYNQNPLFDNQDTTFLLPDVKQQNTGS